MSLSPQPAVPATTVPLVNPFGQTASVAVTGGTITGILVGQPAAPSVVTPAVATTTTPVANPNAFPVAVTVTGGTVTVISVGGVASGLTSGIVVVPPGGTVAITYSVAPTWAWAGLTAGFSGTSIPTPSSVMVPPGAPITLVYSSAPTWAWTNPPVYEPNPYYAAGNTGLINELLSFPVATHAVASQSGLGIGVTN